MHNEHRTAMPQDQKTTYHLVRQLHWGVGFPLYAETVVLGRG